MCPSTEIQNIAPYIPSRKPTLQLRNKTKDNGPGTIRNKPPWITRPLLWQTDRTQSNTVSQTMSLIPAPIKQKYTTTEENGAHHHQPWIRTTKRTATTAHQTSTKGDEHHTAYRNMKIGEHTRPAEENTGARSPTRLRPFMYRPHSVDFMRMMSERSLSSMKIWV